MTLTTIVKTMACAALLLVSSAAHASFVRVGLCNGQTTDASKAKAKTGNGTISAALLLPKSMLANYVGMKATGLRIAIAKTDGLTDMRGWARTDFTASNLASAEVAAPVVGWNEIVFSEPFTIPANQDLVIGYTFEQSKSCKTILLGGLDEDDDFVEANNGCWIGKNGEWENRSNNNDYDGSVCAELIVSDESLPSKNLAPYAVSLSSKAVRIGSPLTATLVFTNLGPETVSGLTYEYSLNGEATTTFRSNAILQQQSCDTLTFEIPTEGMSRNANNILAVKAKADGTEALTQLMFATYDENDTYDYHLLLEEFSTEACSNCERAIKTLEQMATEGLTATCTQITHHVGYRHDFLSVPEDEAYEWLFGNNGTWAPAIMFSRIYDAKMASRDTGVPAPAMSVGYASDFRPQLQYFLNNDALVKVEPKLAWNADTRKLSVDVSVEKSAMFDTQCPAPRLSVILTEDSVRHHQQAGYSSSSNFRHRHVYRLTLSDTWGDSIEWKDDNTAVAHYEVDIPEEWTNHDVFDKENGEIRPDTCTVRQLAVVAFVNEYNSDYRSRCRVYNSNVAELKDILDPTAIVSPLADSVVKTEYYDASGRKLTRPVRGLNIVVKTSDSGKRTVSKVMF